MAERKRTATRKARAGAKPRTKKTAVTHPEPKRAEHRTATEKPVRRGPAHRSYTMAVGRRKSAVARVRFLEKGSGLVLINGQDLTGYFPTFDMQKIVRDPLRLTNFGAGGDVTVKVSGGGKHGQAEAIRLGVSRVLVKLQPDLRIPLKRAGFLTRDPRVKERKKYGLKRARRAPQWQKR